MFRVLSLFPVLLLVGSCQSPPKPPRVDESTKRPANSASVVQLQTCRSDLQNTRILMNESVRSADAARAFATQLERRNASAIDSEVSARQRNAVYAVLFAFGSTRVEVDHASAPRLVEEARSAPLVLLRARTDGVSASAAENRVARERAAAVEAWLVRAGVEPARIRTTWQPVGDHAADNTLPGGRTLNRRVEVEIYRAAPEFIALNSPAEGRGHSVAKPVASRPSEDDHGR